VKGRIEQKRKGSGSRRSFRALEERTILRGSRRAPPPQETSRYFRPTDGTI